MQQLAWNWADKEQQRRRRKRSGASCGHCRYFLTIESGIELRPATHAKKQAAKKPAPQNGLSPGVVAGLWWDYRQNHSVAARDRLVEHYTPWVQQEARYGAKRLGLADVDNAVGEILLALVVKIFPGYDPGPSGRRLFETWARSCIKRKLIDLKRRDGKNNEKFIRGVGGKGTEITEFLAAANDESQRESRFAALVAPLPDKEAVVLWLRYFRGLSLSEVAEAMEISEGAAKTRMHDALAVLREYLAADKEI